MNDKAFCLNCGLGTHEAYMDEFCSPQCQGEYDAARTEWLMEQYADGALDIEHENEEEEVS